MSLQPLLLLLFLLLVVVVFLQLLAAQLGPIQLLLLLRQNGHGRSAT
jgi:hypothetical protein